MKRKEKATRTGSQRRKINRLRLFVVLAVLDILLIVGSLLMLPTALQSMDKATGKPNALFGVNSITVVGNTRYDPEVIVAVSGIMEGQSVYSISERTSEQYILDTFSYVKEVSIDVASGRNVIITVKEYEELGAVYANGKWMVVSREGIGLMEMPMDGDRPLRRLYLKGVDTKAAGVGQQVLQGKDLEIAVEIINSMKANKLTGVGMIDLSDRSNIRLDWKNQIVIELGDDSNINYEIAAVVSLIPRVLSRHGDTATGVLDVSQYSNEKIDSPIVVFTPSSALDTKEPIDDTDNTDQPEE